MVLTILATLATVVVTQTASLTDDARFQRTTRTLEQLETAIVGDTDLRGPDGQRLITGFVADMARAPLTLNELWEIGELEPFEVGKSPAGDSDPVVSVGAGWRGPYLRLPVGADTLTDGWGRPFQELDANGDPTEPDTFGVRMLRSLGADRIAGGDGFGRDLITVFEASAAAEANPDLAGLVTEVPSRYIGGVVLGGVIAEDGSDPGDDISAGEFVVIRVYGPDPESGDVLTLAEFIHDLNSPPFGDGSAVGPTPLAPLFPNLGDDLTVGPRVIRAYQVAAIPATPEEDLSPITNPGSRASRPLYFVNVPGGLPPLPALVLENPGGG